MIIYKKQMVHVWSQCLLSLLLICFLTCCTAARHTSSEAQYDGHASRDEDLGKLTSTKANPELASATASSKAQSEENTSRMAEQTKRLKQSSQYIGESAPRKPILEENTVRKCVFVVESTSKAISKSKEAPKNEGYPRNVRKLLPRQQDMDAFVAYADYRGPQRHPPRNN